MQQNSYLGHCCAAGFDQLLRGNRLELLLCPNLEDVSSKLSCKGSKDYKCSFLFPQCCKFSNWLWILASGNNLIRPSKVNDRPFLDWLNVWHRYVVVVKNNYYLHEGRSLWHLSETLLFSVLFAAIFCYSLSQCIRCHSCSDCEDPSSGLCSCFAVVSSQEHQHHKSQWFNIFPVQTAGVSTSVMCHCQSAVMASSAKQFIASPPALLAIDYGWSWTV